MAQERILIVDGDISLSAMFKARLEAMGYLVDYAVTGSEALEVLKTKWVDLIVLAVVLRGSMNGFQLFKEIKGKKAYRNIPVIVESGKPAMRKMFEAMGVETFFIKPCSLDTLLTEIKDMVSKKILIVSNDEKITEAIFHLLRKYDLQIDVLNTLDRLSATINSFRYSLVILLYKINSTKADILVSLVRGSTKNKKVPVVIFTTIKKGALNKIEAREVEECKKRCEQLGVSSFLDNGFSPKSFITSCIKYLVAC